MSHVAMYRAGRLAARQFRVILDNAKMRGLLDYTETKGVLDVTFHVRAELGVHTNIRKIIRNETAQ